MKFAHFLFTDDYVFFSSTYELELANLKLTQRIFCSIFSKRINVLRKMSKFKYPSGNLAMTGGPEAVNDP